MNGQPGFRFFVLWQSLVVDSYRSFFTHLLRQSKSQVTLVAPHAFKELGGQTVVCLPFREPFANQSSSAGTSHVLRCFSPHVQIALFRGLSRLLRDFYRRKDAPGMFLCIAEPYSLTAFFAWMTHKRVSTPGGPFVVYSAQNIFKKLPAVLSAVQKMIFRRCAAILVCGHEQEQVLRRHGYEGPVIYFPLWYDRDRFFPMDRGEAEKKLRNIVTLKQGKEVRFGYCGGMTEEKGVHDLKKLFSDPRLPHEATLYCAGSGPLAQVIETGGDRMHYLGQLQPDQVCAFMNAVDVLIVPSRTTAHWKEQFGRVIVEAMACGTIVIGSDSGEIPHVIADGTRIFKEGDIEDKLRLVKHWTALVRTEAIEAERNKSLERSKLFSDEQCASNFLAQVFPTVSR